MSDILVPLMYYWMAIGTTINIVKYDFGFGNRPIYNETDVVENPLSCSSSFNASYYVLPDGNIPYEKVRVPVDYLLRAKAEGYSSTKTTMLKGYSELTTNNVDNAIILVVAECKTSEKTVKENTNPTPNWQDHIRKRNNLTHYADKMVYGGQVISLIRVSSLVKGDIQVIRRILKDNMGTSGSVTADTAEMWKKTEKALHESPDIRGQFFIGQFIQVISTQLPATEGKIENFFRYVSELPKFVGAPRDDKNYIPPLYVSFKALHDLDDQYLAVQRDVESERYLAQLYRLLDDAEITDSEVIYVRKDITKEIADQYRDFITNLANVRKALWKAFYTSLSAYQTLDKVALQEAFKQYQQGLDNSTVNYFTQFRRLREQVVAGIACGNEFYSPTSGVLRVLDNEVVKKGKVENFEKCRDLCVTDERCRAIGYSDQECLVYYRSTNSAVITSPSAEMKIYDRKCRYRYYDDEIK